MEPRCQIEIIERPDGVEVLLLTGQAACAVGPGALEQEARVLIEATRREVAGQTFILGPADVASQERHVGIVERQRGAKRPLLFGDRLTAVGRIIAATIAVEAARGRT